ncbi:hypothetical protein [Candidatus Thiodictyon syntrophicum]|jgi:hypothetical protein|uniref:Uncharacterized protein n=1 Tax=Candidatus Thiodictyon syntrophicum TaxID=1166950 RepID=A0A2K8U224_9GAMM|nr:hypothetical protein [Candidatus Thiodictyon syntrophicum]AUB79624.1 hypothetical protein THSYN_00720 [Candidatus Thiodictyon syntrophicum]
MRTRSSVNQPPPNQQRRDIRGPRRCRIPALLLFALAATAAQGKSWPMTPQGEVDPQSGIMMLDQTGQGQLRDIVTAMLGREALINGSDLYVRFSIDGGPSPGQPMQGFAAALQPQGRPLVGAGILEIGLYPNWSIIITPDRRGNGNLWTGSVGLRVRQYRILESGEAPPNRRLMMAHYFEWSARVENDQLTLQLKPDGRNDTDDPIVRLIARLFDISPSRVHVAPADPAEVRGLLGAG